MCGDGFPARRATRKSSIAAVRGSGEAVAGTLGHYLIFHDMRSYHSQITLPGNASESHPDPRGVRCHTGADCATRISEWKRCLCRHGRDVLRVFAASMMRAPAPWRGVVAQPAEDNTRPGAAPHSGGPRLASSPAVMSRGYPLLDAFQGADASASVSRMNVHQTCAAPTAR